MGLPVFTARTYELAQAGGFTAFFAFFAAAGMSLPLGWAWEWSVALGVFAVGSLVGAKAAQEFAGELRRGAAVSVAEMPDQDVWEGEPS